jgi:hypothetical protein
VTEELWAQVKPAEAGLLIRKNGRRCSCSGRIRRRLSIANCHRCHHGHTQAADGAEAWNRRRPLSLTIFAETQAALLSSQSEHIKRMGKISDLSIAQKGRQPEDSVSAFLPGIEIFCRSQDWSIRQRARRACSRNRSSCSGLSPASGRNWGMNSFWPRHLRHWWKSRRRNYKKRRRSCGRLERGWGVCNRFATFVTVDIAWLLIRRTHLLFCGSRHRIFAERFSSALLITRQPFYHEIG